jgi:hypothetical protein
MTSDIETMTPKIHPATREMLLDDPLEMQALEVPGDPGLMLRLLVEEYARMGADAEQILELARNPFYQAFHGLWLLFGEDELRRRVEAIVRRSGVIRVRTVERQPVSERLVQIQLPAPSAKGI